MVVKFVIALKQLRKQIRPTAEKELRGEFSRTECPSHTSKPYAEKDVPQPQDLVAWGFTKTKPCCIRVSW
jgi:hypothetical protein